MQGTPQNSPLTGYSWYSSVANVFNSRGLPETIWGPIQRVESPSGNVKAVGDNGESFGLYQIHVTGGLGDSYRNNTSALFDPVLNATIAADAMKPAYEAGLKKGLSGYALTEYVASHSGWPLKTGNMPADYRVKLQRAYRDGYGQVLTLTQDPGNLTSLPSASATGRSSVQEALFQLSQIETADISIMKPADSAKKIAVLILLVLLSLILIAVGLIAFVGLGQATKIVANAAVPGSGKVMDAAAAVAKSANLEGGN